MLASLNEETWRLRCAAVGWPLGFVAYHISLGLERQAGVVHRLTVLPPFSASLPSRSISR